VALAVLRIAGIEEMHAVGSRAIRCSSQSSGDASSSRILPSFGLRRSLGKPCSPEIPITFPELWM
jgi:hypothetical protein